MDSIFVIDFIKSVGFPIFVALYLLIHQTKVIKGNTLAIRELNDWLKTNNKGKK